MTPRQKLLAIQLRKHFGVAGPPNETAMEGFLASVDSAYSQFDRDLELSRRSLELSTRELMGTYEKLKEEREQERQILEAMRASARHLLDPAQAAGLETADGNALGDLLERLIREAEAHQQEIAHREAQYRAVVENVREVIFQLDLEGRWVFLNPAWRQITGFTIEDSLGKTYLEFLAPEDRAYQVAQFRKLLDGDINLQSQEARLQTQEGGIRWVEVYARVLRREGALVGVTGTLNDITERKRSESALLQAQKLESLGVLAGGIAHDFNNLLVAIMGNAELASLSLDDRTRAQRHLQQVQGASGRAAELCRQLLAYSGKGRFVVESLDLNALVEDMLDLLKVSIHKGATLEFDLAANLPLIEADATQIRQAVMNLVINASDAIAPATGSIRVTSGFGPVAREVLDHPHLSHDLPEQDCVTLRVTDTGCGMDEQTLKRIFDPFFTTKFTGRGLGLAAIMGIIRSHRGALQVDSQAGRGTTFTLYFPYAPETGHVPARKLDSHAWHASGTVLLVDDEDGVRELVAEALVQIGFTVLQAHHGQEGLELFQAWNHTISAVILDLSMPVMSGEEAFKAMQELRPEIPVILMSGFSEQESMAELNAEGIAGFLQKPFRLGELRAMLQKVLPAKSAS